MRVSARLILVGFSLLILIGCEDDTGQPPGNLTPMTYLNVIGDDLNTTDYRKILHWWGTDTDGEVIGYLIRWDGGWEPPEGTGRSYSGDTYSYTTASTDTFDVPLGGEFGIRTFTVRAVDDESLIDPVGVSQSFPLENRLPSIEWNPDIPRPSTSLPAVAFGWNPHDDDGRETITRFQVWLDGDSANAWTVTDTIVGVFPERFGDRIDTERTVFVQGFDDALAPTNVISHTWTVESPQGDWLLIDQIGTGNIARWDRTIYSAVIDSITGGSLHTIDLYNGPDFVTGVEIEPLFSLFQGVIWVTGPYREENDPKMARNLATAEPGITGYIEKGGRILIAGQSIIGTGGGLSSDFLAEKCGISSYYGSGYDDHRVFQTDLKLDQATTVLFERNGQPDSLVIDYAGAALHAEFFTAPVPPGIGIYWLRPGGLARMNTTVVPSQDEEPAYLGVLSDYGEGRICLVSTSYARLFPNTNQDPDWEQSIGEAILLFRETLVP